MSNAQHPVDNQATILVTGANGQLGKELQVLAQDYPSYHFLFVTKEELNIADVGAIEKYFAAQPIDFCINCAAYTAVDKAESDPENAFIINGTAVATLAAACKKNNTQLIHISTDYVFDGTATQPYKETDKSNPVSVYGRSKLQGELAALEKCPSTIIIRTAWVFSSFGNNFVKTMLRLMKERESINVVNDQLGCPTYAADLAAAIMQIIASGKSKKNPGIYHYSNVGITNWYAFALTIKELSASSCVVNPISTAQYPTAAKRPAYSVLDTSKIASAFHLEIPAWQDSLEKCMTLLK
ncbi:MAG: dTDP-4-dehydrorhamnose reductase [Ferruginibacter sp.]